MARRKPTTPLGRGETTIFCVALFAMLGSSLVAGRWPSSGIFTIGSIVVLLVAAASLGVVFFRVLRRRGMGTVASVGRAVLRVVVELFTLP
jgi:hypothetical protein